MAKLFELDIVAEGVETTAQLEWLQAHKCDEYQGFLFEQPMTGEAFQSLLKRL